jgi:hypothetical protein
MSRIRVIILASIIAAAAAFCASASAAAGPRTPLTVGVSAQKVQVGHQVRVSVTLTDDDRRGLGEGTLRLTVPKLWTLTGSERAARSFAAVRGRHSLRAAFTLRAPATAAALSTVSIRASATFVSPGGDGRAAGATPVMLVSPVISPFETADATGEPAIFGQSGVDFGIDAAGTGITTPVTTGAGTASASDSYAAILDSGGAPSSSVAQVTVSAQAGSAPNGLAGLLERNTFLQPSSPEGVVLSVATDGAVRLAYNTGGGPFVNATEQAPTAVRLPVTLRLTRNGATYVGDYSTDGGQTWTNVGTATIAAAAAADPQDLAVVHASGVAGTATEADFTGFSAH